MTAVLEEAMTIDSAGQHENRLPAIETPRFARRSFSAAIHAAKIVAGRPDDPR